MAISLNRTVEKLEQLCKTSLHHHTLQLIDELYMLISCCWDSCALKDWVPWITSAEACKIMAIPAITLTIIFKFQQHVYQHQYVRLIELCLVICSLWRLDAAVRTCIAVQGFQVSVQSVNSHGHPLLTKLFSLTQFSTPGIPTYNIVSLTGSATVDGKYLCTGNTSYLLAT